jgi:HSP20 family molecular chaperone IbpA
MTSFFDKLNNKLNTAVNGKSSAGKGGAKNAADESAAASKAATIIDEAASQKLFVDVYQNPEEITIYALAAGVDPGDFDVVIDEENDLITVRGERKRPARAKSVAGKDDLGKFLQQECEWNSFIRKIILPAEVDVVKAEAVFKKGVLVITLPILNVSEGRKLKVVEALSSGETVKK